MKKLIITALTGYLFSGLAFAGGMDDDPIVSKVMIDQIEVHGFDPEDPIVLEGQGWIGKDLNKFWYKLDAEQTDSDLEELELQALYSRAIAVYWDFQVGVRHNFKPEPTQSWLVLGFQGLAPYFYEVDTALFIAESGQVGLRVEAEYEILLTQQWIITPEVEFHFHSKDNPVTGVGSGLSDSHASLRIRYEIRREFAPYVGFSWSNKYGKSAKFARDSGLTPNDGTFVAGVRAWF